MRTYIHLTREQRYQIRALLRTGHPQVEIAKVIGVHKSTVSRELLRNRGKRGYRPRQAHRMAMARRCKAKPCIAPSTWVLVEGLIRQDWSPEQVSGWLKKTQALQVSHEWIYQHILADKRAGGDLHTHLRCQKARRKRYGSYDRRGKLPNRVSIDERPAIVDSRRRLGDWEADTIVGKGRRQAIVTLTERRSRLGLLKKVDGNTAQQVGDAVIELLKPLAARTYTITSDNGKEFAHHERIAESLEARVYFAHSYSAWERASNENMNGLVRHYFPKGSDFSKTTSEKIQLVMDKLNDRPRKCLDFATPNQVFFNRPAVALDS